MAEIAYKRSAARVLGRMDRGTAGRVLEALEKLAEEPEREDLDVKPLSGTEGFRLRIGDWRVLSAGKRSKGRRKDVKARPNWSR